MFALVTGKVKNNKLVVSYEEYSTIKEDLFKSYMGLKLAKDEAAALIQKGGVLRKGRGFKLESLKTTLTVWQYVTLSLIGNLFL